MEQTNVNSCKFILNTYEQGDNKYEDTTFSLRAPFRPNSNGQYKVTINEIFFRNNEATLVADKDYYEFKIYVNDETNPIRIIRVQMTKDVYTYQAKDKEKILGCLTPFTVRREGGEKDETFCEFIPITWPHLENYEKDENGKYEPTDFINQITLQYINEDEDRVEYEGLYDFPQRAFVSLSFNKPIEEPEPGTIDDFKWVNNIYKVEMSYTDNWGYVLNNMNLTLTGELGTGTYEISGEEVELKEAIFTFYNLRVNGPYIYVVDTPLTSTVNTYNANNQAYNVVALCYNTASVHNVPVQMTSSMECTCNDLSNFRVRLLNDQFDPVPIHEPMYIQLTLSNNG